MSNRNEVKARYVKFCLCFFLLSLSVSITFDFLILRSVPFVNTFRVIRGVDLYEAKAKKILTDILEEKGLSLKWSPTLRRAVKLWARYISLGIKGSEDLIRSRIRAILENNLEIFKDTREFPPEHEEILKTVYNLI